MALAEMHREDIKAQLRKRYGTVAAFERAHDLPEKSVSDFLRGYKSARVERAVEQGIGVQASSQSEGSDRSGIGTETHRLNDGAR